MKIRDVVSEYATDKTVQKKLGSYDIDADPNVSAEKLPDYRTQYPAKDNSLTDMSNQKDDQIIRQAELFFDKFKKSVPRGYPCWFLTERGRGDKRKLEYGGYTKTSNGIICSLAGSKHATHYNIYIKGIKDDNKQPIFDAAAKLGFDLGSSAMGNGEVSIKPTNQKDLDKSLKEFWSIVIAIENLGSNFNSSDEPDSAKKLQTDLTDISYYLGAAGLIFVATRFMSDDLPQAQKLLPTSTKKGDGTFDIAPGIITKGITKSAYDVQHGNGKSEPLTSTFAIPPEVIVQSAQKLLNPSDNALKITSSLKEDIVKVAELIRRNLVLIRCTESEKNKIDSTALPSDWTPDNGNVLTKFNKLKIPVYAIKDGSRLVEDE